MATNKYLSDEEIRKLLGDIVVPESFTLMSQDSYNETLIGKAILATKNETALLQATINMAIVGFGNKNYGTFGSNGNIIAIGTLLKNCGVKTNNAQNSIIKEDELTPQRLCRFFRFFIRDYIRANNTASYIYRKYSNHDPKFAEISFRGAEYLDDLTEEQQVYLISVAQNMDKQLNTNIEARVKRIFAAKNGTRFHVIPDSNPENQSPFKPP